MKMFTLPRLLAAVIFTIPAISSTQAQTIISYNFGVGASNTTPSIDTIANVTGGSATFVNATGVVTTSNPSSGYTLNANGTSVAASGDYQTALNQLAAGGLDLTTSTYIQLTLTPDAGTQVALNYIGFGARVLELAQSASTYSIRSSLDNYATSIVTQTFTQDGTYHTYQSAISLTGAIDQAVTLRIYLYGSNGVLRSGSTRIDDLTLGAVPEPSTYVLLGLAGLVMVVAMRRRRVS